MKNLLAAGAAGLMLFACVNGAQAQTTDAYHSIQVIPVVVDSASFTQQFNFTTPNQSPVTIHAKFFPGDGTPQAATGPVVCDDVNLVAQGKATLTSLRNLCPALVPGTAFGFLYLKAADSSDGMYSDIPVFAAFSRVSNPAGNGFSVEAFAANTFTSATTVVNGLRRLAATANSPAFQTNCFLANLNQTEGDPNPTKRITYTLYTTQGGGPTAFVDLAPGQFVRLLDVFAAAGAPAGDYNNIAALFSVGGTLSDPYRPGLMTFCTVQDNTSFGADFRIGKVVYGTMGIASNDGMAAREAVSKQDVQGRVFEIGAGNSANTHVVYFKHPDTVQCELLNPNTFARLTPTSGLEIRATDAEQIDYVGGNNATGTGLIYLGDKSSQKGYNNRYIIEVESNETNDGAPRAYALYCASGSGNTYGYDLIKYKEAVDRF